MRKIGIMLVLLAVLFAAAVTEAKEGMYLAAEMVFVDIGGTVNTGGSIAAGDGGGVMAGYGISRNFAIEASVRSSDHLLSDGRRVGLTAALFGVKMSLPLAKSHLEPYLVIGIGKYLLDTTRGDGWRYGAGVAIHLSPAFSLSLGISRDSIDFGSSPRVSGDATSMDIGIAYYFL